MSAPNAPSRASAPSSEQGVAVVTALAANVAVAIAKLAAASFTGSSALIAESLHSLADSVNEVLLLTGARRSRRPADLRHPFGHARYRYVYAFVVSLAVFWLGGVLAVVQGVSQLGAHDSLVDPRWAFAVLGIAAALEGCSLRTTIRTARPAKGARSWWRLLQVTKAPEIIVVLLEDLGALVGICIALLGVTLATVTGQREWDAIAAIAIGGLLMSIGLVVNRETQSLLVGESASIDVVAAIRRAIASTDGVHAVVDLRTIHVGPDDLVIAARVVVDPSDNATGVTRAIADAGARARRVAPFRTVIYIEPRLSDDESSAGSGPTERRGSAAEE
jgi:cation diffusion facilitator family transporter